MKYRRRLLQKLESPNPSKWARKHGTGACIIKHVGASTKAIIAGFGRNRFCHSAQPGLRSKACTNCQLVIMIFQTHMAHCHGEGITHHNIQGQGVLSQNDQNIFSSYDHETKKNCWYDVQYYAKVLNENCFTGNCQKIPFYQ